MQFVKLPIYFLFHVTGHSFMNFTIALANCYIFITTANKSCLFEETISLSHAIVSSELKRKKINNVLLPLIFRLSLGQEIVLLDDNRSTLCSKRCDTWDDLICLCVVFQFQILSKFSFLMQFLMCRIRKHIKVTNRFLYNFKALSCLGKIYQVSKSTWT